MSGRYREESRVNQGSGFVGSQPGLTPAEVATVRALLRILRNQEANYPLLSADQDNFPLKRAIVHRFDPTGATRTITGFRALDLDSQIRVILNTGSQNLVLAHNSGLSAVQNQIICHTSGNITLNQNESALIIYDRTSARVRTLGFV